MNVSKFSELLSNDASKCIPSRFGHFKLEYVHVRKKSFEVRTLNLAFSVTYYLEIRNAISISTFLEQ